MTWEELKEANPTFVEATVHSKGRLVVLDDGTRIPGHLFPPAPYGDVKDYDAFRDGFESRILIDGEAVAQALAKVAP